MKALRNAFWMFAFLGAALAVSARCHAAGMYKCTTRHYVIETNVSQDFAEEMGELMEILHAGYSKVFSGKPNFSGVSPVIIYTTEAEYASAGGAPGSLGHYDPGSMAIRAFQSTVLRTRVLPHEGFHQFWDKYITRVQGSHAVNEGLAELFACSLIDGVTINYGLVKKAEVEAIRKYIIAQDRLSVKDLFLMDIRQFQEDESAQSYFVSHYLQARLFMHFLRLAYNEKYLDYLVRCVKAIRAGRFGADALATAFGVKFKEIANEFDKWVAEDLKPGAPECCTANLFHLAQLYYQFQKAGVEFKTLDELKEKVKENKDLKWKVIPITLDTDNAFGPDDIETAEKWFVCPKCGKGYELLDDPDAPEEGLPMIVCYAHHPKLAVCASFEKVKSAKGEEGVWPDVRNRQVAVLRKLAKEAKKKKK